MRRFKPRFSLAALMIVVTATSVLLWGIPEWRKYARRREFERAASQLVVGPDVSLFEALPTHAHNGKMTSTVYSDAEGNPVTLVPFFYDRYWYCLYFTVEYPKAKVPSGRRGGRRVPSQNWSEVRVYRLAPVPTDYSAQSDGGRSRWESSSADGQPPDAQQQYLWDFYQVITGRESSNLGIRFELIHADPPRESD
jgi:hypothetical protein